ncbi:DUF2842 domain-containing protein [Sphingomicrobium sediminis]|uniref:DUF2842 domain-containing protein n=1 Tax=Sphingomicrobium sediminis TaxID=2950949 RepID=A0A9X2EFJ1_9SPHN|nr:DUF2842 domain-containing protein [Sphingomicrobium sediminis]MCM8557053.1 DUF2842 domain-containing protein [Sphingomicrobium sediminis]
MSVRDHEPVGTPKGRVALGVFGICAWIIAWTILAVTIADWIQGWPVLLQMVFYLIAGLGWVLPLKPALRWMETGNWR